MHADSDPLTPSSISNARWCEASDDVEIGYSSSFLLPLLAVSLVMTLVSAGVALRWPYDGDLGSYAVLAGCAGTVLFVLVTGKLVWILVRKRAVVFVTRYGIRDLRIANHFILWDSVTEISCCERRGRRVVALKITPALQAKLSLDSAGPGKSPAGRALLGDSIIIDPTGLTAQFDALLRTCQEHYGKRSAAMQQSDGRAPCRP